MDDNDKSRRFWYRTIGFIDATLFFGACCIIYNITSIVVEFDIPHGGIIYGGVFLLSMGGIAYANNCFMAERDRRFPTRSESRN